MFFGNLQVILYKQFFTSTLTTFMSKCSETFFLHQATTISQGNVLGKKVHGPKIKSFKEPKQQTLKVDSAEAKILHLRKLSTGGRVACNTRHNSWNGPFACAKTSLPNLNQESRDRSKTTGNSASTLSLHKGKNYRRSSLVSVTDA
jgi:hypothetical protein